MCRTDRGMLPPQNCLNLRFGSLVNTCLDRCGLFAGFKTSKSSLLLQQSNANHHPLQSLIPFYLESSRSITCACVSLKNTLIFKVLVAKRTRPIKASASACGSFLHFPVIWTGDHLQDLHLLHVSSFRIQPSDSDAWGPMDKKLERLLTFPRDLANHIIIVFGRPCWNNIGMHQIVEETVSLGFLKMRLLYISRIKPKRLGSFKRRGAIFKIIIIIVIILRYPLTLFCERFSFCFPWES